MELDYDMWLGPARPGALIPNSAFTAARDVDETYSRPGWYGNRTYCDGGICSQGHHIADNVR